MKKTIIFSFSLLVFITVKGQNPGFLLYQDGSSLIEIGDYKKADSILTMALCTYKHQNVYFNRGLARLYINDTIGFCRDMNYAANKYFDSLATILFTEYCCMKIDTIYYDKKLAITSINKFRYYETIRHLKFDSLIIGFFHDNKAEVQFMNMDWGCENNLLNMNLNTCDIVAIYELRDSIKYYRYISKVPFVKNPIKYEDLMKRSKILFEAKYGFLKADNNLKTLGVYFSLMINKIGEIEEVHYLGLVPNIEIGDVEKEIEKDIISIGNLYPKMNPASFKGENVYYISTQSIVY